MKLNWTTVAIVGLLLLAGVLTLVLSPDHATIGASLLTGALGLAVPTSWRTSGSPKPPPGTGALLMLLAALAVPSMACAHRAPHDTAQRVATSAAHVLDDVDQQVAPLLEGRSAAVRAELRETDLAGDAYTEAWEESMRPLLRAEQALRTSASTLRTLQSAVDAWRAGDEGDSYRDALPCTAMALDRLERALRDAGVPVPASVTALLDQIGAAGRRGCVEDLPEEPPAPGAYGPPGPEAAVRPPLVALAGTWAR